MKANTLDAILVLPALEDPQRHLVAVGRVVGNRDLLAFFEGSAFLVWFFRAQGAQIGGNVCLYPDGRTR